MDHAKFEVPRIRPIINAMEALYRQPLHIHGVWAHGFCYQLAVADSDMMGDTNNNVETISRALDTTYAKHGALPLGLHLQQDNTCRECKNQLITMWAVQLVALKVFRWVTLADHRKGHSHEDIDGTYGQLTCRLANCCFDDPDRVV